MSEEKTTNEIWLQKPDESNRHYKFFTIYCQGYERSLEKFHEKVLREYQQNSTKSPKPPTLNTMKKWCSNDEWIKRRDAFIKHLNSEELPSFIEEQKKLAREEVHTIQRIKKNVLYQLMEDPTIRSSDIKNFTQALNNLNLEERLLKGEPSEITKGDVNVSTPDLSSLFDHDRIRQIEENENRRE